VNNFNPGLYDQPQIWTAMMRNNNYNQVANGIQRAFLLVFIVLCFSSTGQGTDQWMSLGPEGVATNSIAIHPLNSSTLYAGSNGDVVKSTDDGNTWNQIFIGICT
jgi:hypothetical protein